MRILWITGFALVALGCTTPQKDGKRIDPAQFARAEQRCEREAVSRYGPTPRGPRREGDQCDAQSWLCRKTQAWMLKEGNPLSDATPRDRLVHEYTQACLKKQGYSGP